ncbi:putative amidase AmiD [Meiothermus granaticius NBRC 107808]|uniref:Putative amidase AmiD n=2 Tax=Meiothermus TaxID=65551 RepID=A0A399F627_9DEIN|nr:putative amidase AmiD [Meiothermus granaticius NBRC 107808]
MGVGMSHPAPDNPNVSQQKHPARDWERFVSRQVAEQTAEHRYPLRRVLEFPPFEPLGAARMAELEALTARATIPELQAEMEAGRLSAVELTRFYLTRIRQHNDRLGAWLEVNPQGLEQAQQLDAERGAGRVRGLLHGIPLALKDNLATAAPLHTTAGAAALREAMADREAFIVQRLRAAGALVLGKNNLSEWANFMTTHSVNGFSALGGHTRNPYGPFDVGGSSSGTAVAVAANLAVAGVGSETSGSLVYPAAQNGIFTLKPSLGLVSRDRIIPITEAQDTAGPLTKNATDLAVLMGVLTAYDPADPLTQRAKALEPGAFALQGGSLAGLRIGWIEHTQRTGDLEGLGLVVQAFQRLGAEVKVLPFPTREIEMLPVLRYGLREGVNAYLRATGAPIPDLAAVIAFNEAHPEAAPYGQDLLIAAQNEGLAAEEYHALVEKNRQVGTEVLEGLMQEHEVSLLLTVSNSLSAYTSTSGFPVLTFPAGYRASGEPIGASLVGRLLEDPHLIAVAQALRPHLEPRKTPVL